MSSILACLAFVACATKQFEPDFTTYSEAYAQNQNWQMLLNIARLDQGYPSYFLAIGAIHLLRNQTGSLQGAGTMSRTAGQTVTTAVSRTVSNVLSGTLTPNASTNVQPSFDFIPINSTEAAQQLLAPISIDAFNTLYQQGWPVDELLRVMVERIEVDFYGPNGKDNRLVLTNSPARAENWRLFARFLRACEVVRELQKKGGLRLVAEEAPAKPDDVAGRQGPYVDAGSSSGAAAPAKGGGKGKGAGAGGAADDTSGSKGGAAEKQITYRFEADPTILNEVLADLSQDPSFRLAGPEEREEQQAAQARAEALGPPDQAGPMWNFSQVFKSPLTVSSGSPEVPAVTQADEGQPPPPRRPKPGTVHTVLVLRSFRNMLDAAAQEQRAWDALAGDSSLHFLDYVPARQRQPVLRTDWSGKQTPLLPPVISVTFHGQHYAITDPKDGDPLDVDSRWNRDVFRLLIDLSAQVSVDITKFQRPVLELSQ
ncbi:MAG TPA: hypothetical protein VMD31_09800 [Opitutaceae bacterium]|nr:hypothetical protein [Opitutaceae bacterium]